MKNLLIIPLLLLSSFALGQDEYIDIEDFEFYRGVTDSSVSEIPCLFVQDITSDQKKGSYIVFRKVSDGYTLYDYVNVGSEFGANFTTTGKFCAVGLDLDGEVTTHKQFFEITEDHCEYGYSSGKKAPPIVLIQL
jgi:hypothetical protein|tara:strand:+ start:212 stop:616 length:405 start_codon:yes stop_codon:yes gene_type:complete